ncbi:leucyl/phenylalanyl-tRNA--protein transferase [Rhodobacteraceae bacterium WD3A24]|nr:leucyl/phenylalanyl-tRNA--protein transferase [Rhodobacteraceae bacterium WD3A24]
MTPPLLTPDLLLRAYAAGIFPMSESRSSPSLHWIDPHWRGVVPLDGFHISRSLARRLRRADYTIRCDADFTGTVAGCAGREETWINDTLFGLYLDLHGMGFAHSLEVWEDGVLTGGVFGIALRGAFFGESMFSRQRDASKIALAYLVDRLREGGFRLFDTQFISAHLQSLGAEEISRAAYRRRLENALAVEADFFRLKGQPPPQEVIQRNTQTS